MKRSVERRLRYVAGLVERGLNRPRKIPRYVFGTLVPSSRWGATWRERDGAVRFEPGGYASSPRNRPEFASNLYHEVSGLEAVFDEHGPTGGTALEIGCGYGRLSPWIAARADSYLGVDPDAGAVRRAATLYPDLAFALGCAQSIPCRDNAVDALVTWTVLQHVPDDSMRAVAAEIRRTLAPDGLLVACERVRPPADDHIWPRSLETYDRLLAPLERVDSRQRPVEPTWSRATGTETPPERLFAYRAP